MTELGLTWKEVIYITFMAGACWLEFRAIRRDIARLEAKVEQHNSFDRRIVINKGWDAFPSEDAAAVAYGLEYHPIEDKK